MTRFLLSHPGTRLAAGLSFHVFRLDQRDEFRGEIAANGEEIVVKGRVEASPPVCAVVAYCNPEGGIDYDARTASAISDKHGNFALECSDLPAGKAGELRIVPLHFNGATADWLSQSPEHLTSTEVVMIPFCR